MRLLVVSLLVLLAAGPAVGQMPRQPDPPAGRDPGGLPNLPQGLMPGNEPVPVVPDTAIVELGLDEGSTRPVALDMAPAPVEFGGIVALVIRYRVGQAAPRLAGEPAAPWLEPVLDVTQEHLDRLEAAVAALPGAADAPNTVIVPVRIYRTDPFVLTSGDVRSPVIEVRGRTTDLSETAAIRAPRVRGWNLLVIVALAISAVLLVLLVWALWRRRNAPVVIEDWQPAPPGWLAAAVRLQQLIESRGLERGAGRENLNDLASITRGFVADHFGVAAREMTGGEIVQACGARGHRLEPVRALARLIDDCDRRRYDPDPVPAAWVRTRTAELIARMQELRIEPRQTAVKAAERLEADRAWAGLQEYARREVPAGAPQAGEAG